MEELADRGPFPNDLSFALYDSISDMDVITQQIQAEAANLPK
jgi:hypothetical protein